jgi:hypothetical protein
MGDAARAARAQGGAQLISRPSLHTIVLVQTGEDVDRCGSCALCEEITEEVGDVSLSMLMQWILVNDERALTCATVWSDEVLRRADHVCTNQLDIPAVLLALRAEAICRGLTRGEQYG